MKVTKYILITLAVFAIIYLLAAFIAMNFDLTTWGIGGRFMYCISSLLFSGLLCVAIDDDY